MHDATYLERTADGVPPKVIDRVAPLRPDGRLSISNHKGSILVIGWDREEAEIRAVVEPPRGLGDREYSRRVSEAVEIQVESGPDLCSLASDSRDVPAQRRWLRSRRAIPRVHYRVRAPRGARLVVRDHRSEIELRGLAGVVDVETHKGRVRGEDLAGHCRVATHQGPAVLSCRGRIDLRTHRGRFDVDWREPAGDSSLRSHSGRFLVLMPEEVPLTLQVSLATRAELRCPALGQGAAMAGVTGSYRLHGGGPGLLVQSHKGRIDLRAGEEVDQTSKRNPSEAP